MITTFYHHMNVDKENLPQNNFLFHYWDRTDRGVVGVTSQKILIEWKKELKRKVKIIFSSLKCKIGVSVKVKSDSNQF